MPYLSHQPDRLKSTEQRLLENIDKGSELDMGVFHQKQGKSVSFMLTTRSLSKAEAYHSNPYIS
jgi:hypothetical protein